MNDASTGGGDSAQQIYQTSSRHRTERRIGGCLPYLGGRGATANVLAGQNSRGPCPASRRIARCSRRPRGDAGLVSFAVCPDTKTGGILRGDRKLNSRHSKSPNQNRPGVIPPTPSCHSALSVSLTNSKIPAAPTLSRDFSRAIRTHGPLPR